MISHSYDCPLQDVEIQLAIGDEEPVFRSCDPMEDEEIQPAMGDNEPIFRSCDMHISDAEQDSPLSRLDSPDHQGGGLFGAAPPQVHGLVPLCVNSGAVSCAVH